jgi:hypothetical protein
LSGSRPGVRLEKRLLRVLKALADLKNISLAGLLEGIVPHAFEGQAPFGEETWRRSGFEQVYSASGLAVKNCLFGPYRHGALMSPHRFPAWPERDWARPTPRAVMTLPSRS